MPAKVSRLPSKYAPVPPSSASAGAKGMEIAAAKAKPRNNALRLPAIDLSSKHLRPDCKPIAEVDRLESFQVTFGLFLSRFGKRAISGFLPQHLGCAP
jgi:hypothetical protein